MNARIKKVETHSRHTAFNNLQPDKTTKQKPDMDGKGSRARKRRNQKL
jgi:hypothetical protein